MKYFIGIILSFFILSCAFASAEKEDNQIVTFSFKNFSLKLFETPIPENLYGGCTDADIISAFGMPSSTKAYTKLGHEPSETLQIVERLYDGFILTTSVSSFDPKTVWLDKIEIYNPAVKLYYGLNLGVDKSKIIEMFGKPFHTFDNSFLYGIVTTKEINTFQYGININITFSFDKNEKLKQIVWKTYAD